MNKYKQSSSDMFPKQESLRRESQSDNTIVIPVNPIPEKPLNTLLNK